MRSENGKLTVRSGRKATSLMGDGRAAIRERSCSEKAGLKELVVGNE